MDFYTHQDNARQKTKWLLAGLFFTLAFLLFLMEVLFFVFLLEPEQIPDTTLGILSMRTFWEGYLVMMTAFIVVIAAGSLFKMLQLRKGGSAVAEELGGRLINDDSSDLNDLEKRLLNIVQEMALSANIAVPGVYIIEDDSINAFAAGYQADDAVIGVTTGSLQHLNRDELQGVIAHEFSHILNGDMRINLRMVSVFFGLIWIAFIGRIIFHVTLGSNDKNAKAFVLLGIGIMILGFIGQLATRLTQAAISREREYLADASAVQFTRNPGGIGGALTKIAEHSHEAVKMKDPHTEVYQHMFFGSVGLSGLFSTHPPIADRVARITGVEAKV